MPGGVSSNASNFTPAGQLAYFSANTINPQTNSQQVSLYLSSGGTLNSTIQLADFAQGADLSEFTTVGNQLYFTSYDGGVGSRALDERRH